MLAVRATVRPARREDSPAAAAVVRAVYQEFGFAWGPDGYHADLAAAEAGSRALPGPGAGGAVAGRVPGLDEAGFGEAAAAAKDGWPVSKAVAGVPEITVEARLEG